MNKLRRLARRGVLTAMRGSEWQGKFRATVRKYAPQLLPICGALIILGQPLRAETLEVADGSLATLAAYVQELDAAQPIPVSTETFRPRSTDASASRLVDGLGSRLASDEDDGVLADLRAYAETLPAETQTLRVSTQRIAADPLESLNDRPQFAQADNAFDALREFLQKQNGSAPPERPAAPVAPPARSNAPVIAATLVGSNVCLGCHAGQTETFSHTLMGRMFTQGKMQCETCHGPGSAHVHSVGCAACHGDGGITTRPGIPSLVGLDPQYLVSAMKEYVTGQRKHALMRALLSTVGEAELNNIALYYARQTPAQAQTPPVGDPSAGKVATALCAGCHGERGVSASPAFPSLAGQDARYLADALRAYRDGSRDKVVACAACHGEGGISKTPGSPSLVGLDPKYLVPAMKAYVTGQRKHTVMKALLSGVGEAELNNIALYYVRQSPARAPTPPVGDPSAGKAASASCAGCHGAEGVSANPVWPSLAGQDAQYLADVLEAYKDGSRNDATMKALVAALDARTIKDIASYYASLRPAQPSPTNTAQNASARHDPVLVRNGLVASLDGRTINDIASYYASLHPAQPNSARNAPTKYDPILVSTAAPTDGRSVGGIISFRPSDPGRTAEENNRICLGCHERGERTYWQGSVHEERGLVCTNCHTLMKAVSAQHQLKTAFQPDTCFQCHKDRRAQMFRSSHMPLREGKIVCSDCHNPHGSTTESLLKADSINDNCYKCHAEKRGPFLFEHAPVRENCLNCHDPHGSINEFSLKMSRPRLCYECHTIGHGQTGALNNQFNVGRSCQNCHTLIHGSNSPAGAVFQR
ncbi:MAG: DmsE family decaheme c-type cytochrome [Xanthobacteraceae bacterium]